MVAGAYSLNFVFADVFPSVGKLCRNVLQFEKARIASFPETAERPPHARAHHSLLTFVPQSPSGKSDGPDPYRFLQKRGSLDRKNNNKISSSCDLPSLRSALSLPSATEPFQLPQLILKTSSCSAKTALALQRTIWWRISPQNQRVTNSRCSCERRKAHDAIASADRSKRMRKQKASGFKEL